jgi:broad specificity phosphatase PhoE
MYLVLHGLGQWETHTYAEVHSGWPDNIAGSNRYNWYFRSPDGETNNDVSKRLRKWLKANADHDNLIVVTHGVASRMLILAVACFDPSRRSA